MAATPDHWTLANLGLGSNLGDRLSHLRAGIQALQDNAGIRNLVFSHVYETAPWGVTEQPAFLNLCIAIETTLLPRDLLQLCLETELKAGRLRSQRWGPRTLDIDILTYGTLAIREEGLEIPHPALLERAFVLRPLQDIAPDLCVSGVSIREKLAELDQAGITLVGAILP